MELCRNNGFGNTVRHCYSQFSLNTICFSQMYFQRISLLSQNKALDSRHRFMLQDLIELRRNNWVLRRKVLWGYQISSYSWCKMVALWGSTKTEDCCIRLTNKHPPLFGRLRVPRRLTTFTEMRRWRLASALLPIGRLPGGCVMARAARQCE